MTLNRKGSRRIVVGDVTYRWRLRRKPTYSQALCWSACAYAVEHADHSGSVLIVTTNQAHPGNWLSWPPQPVPPSDVARAIQLALSRGWAPTTAGSPFQLDLSEGLSPSG
ncbi:hypothetical protein OCT49_24590 [Streptomyces sp. ML-6]|nr:hypothetical protein [Streptomyces sp. ML-6]MDK0522194.1 hypothetical protein [Streptomyces sp. ML-6]